MVVVSPGAFLKAPERVSFGHSVKAQGLAAIVWLGGQLEGTRATHQAPLLEVDKKEHPECEPGSFHLAVTRSEICPILKPQCDVPIDVAVRASM